MRGEVYNVSVPDADENVEAGWGGKEGCAVAVDDVEEIVFPHLVDDVGGGGEFVIQRVEQMGVQMHALVLW